MGRRPSYSLWVAVKGHLAQTGLPLYCFLQKGQLVEPLKLGATSLRSFVYGDGGRMSFKEVRGQCQYPSLLPGQISTKTQAGQRKPFGGLSLGPMKAPVDEPRSLRYFLLLLIIF